MTKHSTKKALMLSLLSMLLCVSMLVGSTFAWFTDTASTAVNTIQAGTLDVVLEMKNADGTWENAEGKTLEFKKATGAPADEAVLWEPGCTYELPALRVRNNGNLALQYKIQLTGIKGSAKLNEAIEWTISDDSLDSVHTLAAGATSEELTIKGHMKEDAGNEYQGLTIDGIAITVYATQYNSEYDIEGNTYDKDAEYNYKSATIIGGGKTITLEKGVEGTSKTYTVGAATVTVDESGNITYTNTSGTAQTVTITTDGGNLTINAPLDTVKHYGTVGIVTVTAVASESYHEFGKAGVLEIAQGRVVVENGNNVAVLQVKPTDGAVPVVAVPQSVVLETKLQVAAEASVKVTVIDSESKEIIARTGTEVEEAIPAELEKVLNKGADGKTVTLDEPKNYVAMIGTEPYETFAEAVNAVQNGETIKLTGDAEVASTEYNSNADKRLKVTASNVTIDLNQKTLTVPNYTLILDGDNIILKNGNMVAVPYNNASQTYGSYAVVPGGKNNIITGVKMLGGVNVTGDNSGNAERDTTVTITNCEITATNYYTVCAQSNAEATIENTKLIGGAGTFFWVEEKGYSEGGAPLANVSSKIIYDAKTVEFSGTNALYNPVGVAVVVKNLTVKDAEGNEQTIDAVAVSTEAHLRTLVAAGENVMLASDITLSAPITIGTTSTNNTTIAIVGNGHKLGGSAITSADCNGGDPRAINVWDGTNMTVILKDLTVVGPEAASGRGITTGDTNGLVLILDDCEVSASYYAINVYEKAQYAYNPKVIVRNTTLKNVSGYCAINIWSQGTNATFENCTLIGVNKFSGTSDDFATIVIVNDNGADNAKNSTLTFKNCTIEAVEDGTATEYLLSVRATGAKVTFEGCKFFVNGEEVTGDATKENMQFKDDTTLTIK